MSFTVRPLEAKDASWLTGFMTERWGVPVAAGGGRLHQLDDLPGFAAVSADDAVAGVVTYLIEADACEVVSIDALAQGQGVGTALLEAACEAAAAAGCRRVWLITTNDNVDALRFYQRRGFALTELRPRAVGESRRLKPQIPLVGAYGIPIRDELVLLRELP
ncbi:MAG TPA: GNAT family N-acetyltransferase [Gaiellales bacterium]|jgi:ribosomal protein S18 acetylase RimI-like enzyme|nr:GNAT family N-acetyltransferase [Gaiellales bacterium]